MGGYIYPPCRIFWFSIGKRYQRGVKVVCKLKFSKLLDNKKDFRSKNFFGAEPRALKVEWVANFRISKSWFFLLWPKIFGTKYGFQSEFSHPTPRIGCQFSYAKEMRWIGRKMTERGLFSWWWSKFLKISYSGRITIFVIFAKIWISTMWAQLCADGPKSMFTCKKLLMF